MQITLLAHLTPVNELLDLINSNEVQLAKEVDGGQAVLEQLRAAQLIQRHDKDLWGGAAPTDTCFHAAANTIRMPPAVDHSHIETVSAKSCGLWEHRTHEMNGQNQTRCSNADDATQENVGPASAIADTHSDT